MTQKSKPVNNAELKAFLHGLRPRCQTAQNRADLDAIFADCITFPYQFKIDPKKYILAISIALIAALLFINSSLNYGFELFLTSIALSLIFLFVLNIQYKRLASVERLIIAKTMQILYKSQSCSSKFLDQKINSFVDFNRGNYANELSYGTEIEFNSHAGKLRVAVVTLTYTDKHVTTDSKGNQEVEYRHYYRQGVIFPPVSRIHSLAISRTPALQRWRETFKPASIKFQQLLPCVHGASELIIAKFLEPAVVLILEKAASEFGDLSVEFSESGEILICQSYTGLFSLDIKNKLANPDLLKEELFNSSYKQLDYLLGFANNLIKQIK